MILFDRDIKKQVLDAKKDQKIREELIKQKETLILKIASKACMKYVTKNDDEYSIALLAFSKAIDSYKEDRGDFMAFATTIIKRDLIDYHRHEEKYSQEISVSPSAFDDNGDEEETAITHAVNKYSIEKSKNNLVEEINALSENLKEFGINFMDLTECSPKQEKTRNECLKISKFIAFNNSLYNKLIKKHQLPASEIIKQIDVSTKTLDKYRKYIIASTLILNDDYPSLAGYLRPTEGW